MFSLWTILSIGTFIEMYRAAAEYAHDGRGLGYCLTVVMPLLVLLPLMIGHQLVEARNLWRCGEQKTWVFYQRILLTIVFTVALVLLIYSRV